MTTSSATATTPETIASRPRLALWLGAAGLAVFFAIAVSMAASLPEAFSQPLDDAWRALVGASSVDQVDGPLPMFFQYFGEGPGFLVFLVIVPIALLALRRWRTAIFWVTAVMGANLVISQVPKNLLDRARPADDAGAGLYGPLFDVDHGSFPSGHATTMGAVLIAVAALIPLAYRRYWWPVAALLALGIVWQRTLINAHWLTDAVVGLIGGASFVLLLWWAFEGMLAKDRGRPLLQRRVATAASSDADEGTVSAG